MYTDEEMAGQIVKYDIDEETGETKENEDRTHGCRELRELLRIAGRGQHSLSIYIYIYY